MNKIILVVFFSIMTTNVMALDTNKETSMQSKEQTEQIQKSYMEKLKDVFTDNDNETKRPEPETKKSSNLQKERKVIGINGIRETKDLCGQVAASFFNLAEEINDESNNEQLNKSFKLLEPHWPLQQGDLIKLSEKTKEQLSQVYKNFGKPTKTVDFIRTQKAGKSFVKHTYIVKYEKTALRYSCVFYKPKNLWFVHSINWDNMVALLFE